MGMAASQARLLTLTSRLHDIEYKAQNIESQKIALATQKDELYQAYCDALDAKKIQVAYNNGDGSKFYVDANFSTLCTYSEDRIMQYSLKDAKTGKVLVDEDTAAVYEVYGNDKYSFAWAMLGMEGNFSWNGVDGSAVGFNTQDGDNYMTEVEKMVFDNHVSDDSTLSDAYNELEEAAANGTQAEKREALEKFRDVLYGNTAYKNEIYQNMRYSKQDDKDKVIATGEYDDCYPEDFPSDEFTYYLNLYEEITACDGCQVIEGEYKGGDSGNEWFNNMINSGRVLIDVYNNGKWTETSVATSTNANYLQEVEDETDLKKAEAEYEYELDKINTKDTKYDQDLSKLETERTSITTEIESIEKVRDDNIERTFGIFS